MQLLLFSLLFSLKIFAYSCICQKKALSLHAKCAKNNKIINKLNRYEKIFLIPHERSAARRIRRL